MYLKDGVLYIKTDSGYEEVIPMLHENGGLVIKRNSNPVIHKQRPVGAKPVLSCEVIAQLGLIPGVEHSATSGVAPTADDEDDAKLPLTEDAKGGKPAASTAKSSK